MRTHKQDCKDTHIHAETRGAMGERTRDLRLCARQQENINIQMCKHKDTGIQAKDGHTSMDKQGQARTHATTHAQTRAQTHKHKHARVL